MLFCDLVNDGALTIFDYSFFSNPVQSPGAISIANIQDPEMRKPNSYPMRYLEHEYVRAAFPDMGQCERGLDS